MITYFTVFSKNLENPAMNERLKDGVAFAKPAAAITAVAGAAIALIALSNLSVTLALFGAFHVLLGVDIFIICQNSETNLAALKTAELFTQALTKNTYAVGPVFGSLITRALKWEAK